MNLDNLKPAWKQVVLFNSMQQTDQNEILSIIEQVDHQTTGRLSGFVKNAIIIVTLTVCCQGG